MTPALSKTTGQGRHTHCLNAGVMCPVSMTYSVIPALRLNEELAAEWEPRLTLPSFDDGALAGMAMTEKQGGSDVRANTTSAEPAGDGLYEITGHKWFCSYPPCDVFLTLAQGPEGLSCFLIEGDDPGFRVQRLKDKLGTRSLPSSEVEFHGVKGRLVGEEGRGVAAITRMVNHTRLDCLIGSAAGIRWGTAQAVHHARHRSAFGAPLAEQPLMRNVLADLAIESEAATATAMRVARAYDEDRRAVPPARHRGQQVLGVQAGAGARRRGAGVPGRQRLRGGVGDAAPAARLAAELDLGGLGQRRRPGRAAGDGQGARGDARLHGRAGAGPGRDLRLDAHLDKLRGLPGQRPAVAGPQPGRGPRARAPGQPADPPRARGGVPRLLRLPAEGTAAACFGTLPTEVDAEAIVERALGRVTGPPELVTSEDGSRA